MRSGLTRAVAVMAIAGLAGCGGGVHDTVAVRVGSRAISNAKLIHWMVVLAPQHRVPDPPRYRACIGDRKAVEPQSDRASLRQECRRVYRALQQHALDFLISSEWLIGEAEERGLAVSHRDIDERIAVKRRSFSDASEFRESLRAVGQTLPDLELEVEAQLASSKIRRTLVADERKVSQAEIASFYAHNMRRFHVPEQRRFDIVENLKSKALARQSMREIARGASIDDMSLHESLPRPRSLGHARAIVKAIFAAPENVVVGPVRVNRFYFLVKVTRISPAMRRTLGQVASQIGRKLTSERRRRTLSRFVAAWRRRWIVQTDCAPGYVVDRCRQYTGPPPHEDPLSLT